MREVMLWFFLSCYFRPNLQPFNKKGTWQLPNPNNLTTKFRRYVFTTGKSWSFKLYKWFCFSYFIVSFVYGVLFMVFWRTKFFWSYYNSQKKERLSTHITNHQCGGKLRWISWSYPVESQKLNRMFEYEPSLYQVHFFTLALKGFKCKL